MTTRQSFMSKLVVLLTLLLTLSAPSNVSAQTPVPEQWVKYEFDNGVVSILSPIKLRAVDVTIPADLPLEKTVTASGGDSGRILTFTFSILKTDSEAWTAGQRESFYVGIWEGIESSFRKTLRDRNLSWTIQLVEMKAVTISGHVGRQIGYSFGPYKGTMRALVLGKRSYVASVLSLPEIHAQLSERYLSSFTITPTAPAKGARTERGRSLWA